MSLPVCCTRVSSCVCVRVINPSTTFPPPPRPQVQTRLVETPPAVPRPQCTSPPGQAKPPHHRGPRALVSPPGPPHCHGARPPTRPRCPPRSSRPLLYPLRAPRGLCPLRPTLHCRGVGPPAPLCPWTARGTPRHAGQRSPWLPRLWWRGWVEGAVRGAGAGWGPLGPQMVVWVVVGPLAQCFLYPPPLVHPAQPVWVR